jgi:hypothetical protein
MLRMTAAVLWFNSARIEVPDNIDTIVQELQRIGYNCCRPRMIGHGQGFPRAAMNSRGERYPRALCG